MPTCARASDAASARPPRADRVDERLVLGERAQLHLAHAVGRPQRWAGAAMLTCASSSASDVAQGGVVRGLGDRDVQQLVGLLRREARVGGAVGLEPLAQQGDVGVGAVLGGGLATVPCSGRWPRSCR